MVVVLLACVAKSSRIDWWNALDWWNTLASYAPLSRLLTLHWSTGLILLGDPAWSTGIRGRTSLQKAGCTHAMQVSWGCSRDHRAAHLARKTYAVLAT